MQDKEVVQSQDSHLKTLILSMETLFPIEQGPMRKKEILEMPEETKEINIEATCLHRREFIKVVEYHPSIQQWNQL